LKINIEKLDLNLLRSTFTIRQHNEEYSNLGTTL
jgi:hypothetical protein